MAESGTDASGPQHGRADTAASRTVRLLPFQSGLQTTDQVLQESDVQRHLMAAARSAIGNNPPPSLRSDPGASGKSLGPAIQHRGAACGGCCAVAVSGRGKGGREECSRSYTRRRNERLSGGADRPPPSWPAHGSRARRQAPADHPRLLRATSEVVDGRPKPVLGPLTRGPAMTGGHDRDPEYVNHLGRWYYTFLTCTGPVRNLLTTILWLLRCSATATGTWEKHLPFHRPTRSW